MNLNSFEKAIVSDVNETINGILSVNQSFDTIDAIDLTNECKFKDKPSAEKYIVDFGVIQTIELVSNCEKENAGEDLNDYSDVVGLANSLYYWISRSMLDSIMLENFSKFYVETSKELKILQILLNKKK